MSALRVRAAIAAAVLSVCVATTRTHNPIARHCRWSRSVPPERRSFPRSKVGDRTRMARSSSCSATTTGTRVNRWIFRSGRTTGSSRAAPITASRPDSSPASTHGVFAIRVPKDFGNKKLTWTITVNGQTTSVAFWTNPPYWIDFFEHAASGNKPPVIKFAANGPELTGPPLGFAQTLSAAVGQPVHTEAVGIGCAGAAKRRRRGTGRAARPRQPESRAARRHRRWASDRRRRAAAAPPPPANRRTSP